MRLRDFGRMRSLTTRELFSEVPAALPDYFSSSSNIGVLIAGGACSPNALTPLAVAARTRNASFGLCPAEGFDQLHARALMEVSVESIWYSLRRRVCSWLEDWYRTRSEGKLFLFGHSYGCQRAMMVYDICRQMDVPVAGMGLVAPAFCLKDIQFTVSHGMYSGKFRGVFDWLARNVGTVPYLLRWNGGIADYFRDRRNGRVYEDRYVLQDVGVFDIAPIYFAGQYFGTIDLAVDIARKVDCPVTAFWPLEDRMVKRDLNGVFGALRASVHVDMPGDHFFFIEEGGSLALAGQMLVTVLASGGISLP